MSKPLQPPPQYYRYLYKKVAVLGDGVMGSQIACSLINSKIPVILYCTIDIPDEEKEQYRKNILARISKAKPAMLAHKSFIANCDLQFLDTEKGKAELGTCGLVIEAIIEQSAEKRKLYKKVANYLSENAILATNTSGLPINELVEGLSDGLAKNFLGIHFFNPVRYLSFCELILSPKTDKAKVEKLHGFLTTILGKRVVIAKDSPAFIGNRLGLFNVLITFHLAEKYNLPADLVDELTGRLIGRANSATFRTADVVGLDVLKFVADNMKENLPNDPWNKYFELPPMINKLIKENKLGSKTKQGIYHKRKDGIYVFDTSLNDYRKTTKNLDAKLKEIINKKNKQGKSGIAVNLLKISEYDHPQAKFLWDLHREFFLYASHHLSSYTYSVRSADIALCSGFGWSMGIFALWQAVGIKEVIDTIEQNQITEGDSSLTEIKVPVWVKSIPSFYQKEGALSEDGANFISLEKQGISLRQSRSPQVVNEQGIDDKVVFENEGIVAHQINQRIVAVAHKTKMNVLSYDVINGYHQLLDMMEEKGGALVIHQLKPNFGAGANLAEMLIAVKTGALRESGTMSFIKSKAAKMLNSKLPDVSSLPPLAAVIQQLQNLTMRIKHGKIPVVSCVDGLALGGCCELLMHCTKVVASINSYIGLVEIGVGLLPGGGGTKEMAFRAAIKQGITPGMNYLAEYATNILMAKVSTSAYEAIDLGYLTENDTIIANPDELFYTGCRIAESLLESDYHPISEDTLFPVVGRDGYANILTTLENMYHGNFISGHDRLCAETIAKVICGGDVNNNYQVKSEWILKLELESFLNLLETEKTQERVEHILKTNKPLRN